MANYSPPSSGRGRGWGFISLTLFYILLSTTSPSPINLQTTISISMTNCSPLSSENHRSLFVKPAKRGKQRAGGEALFPLHLFTFNYQPRHRHNCFISQLRWYCAIVSMDEFRNINVLMVQLGTSCSFDSPGLARNEPTPGWASTRRFNAIGVELFLWRHAYNETFYGGLLKKSATPTALVHANRMLPQGSLHYRLATLGYQKRNTYGVETFIS